MRRGSRERSEARSNVKSCQNAHCYAEQKAAAARRKMDVDKVKGCEVCEGEARIEHEICTFHPFG